MAAYILRLRLALLVAPVRGPWRRTVRTVVGLVALALLTAAAVWGIGHLRDAPGDVAFVTTTAIGSLLTFCFFALSFARGRRDPLDLRALAPLPASPALLSAWTGLCGLLSVPILATAVVDVAMIAVWGAHGAPVAAGIGSLVLHLATCALAARLGYWCSDRLLDGHRSAELTALSVIAVLVIFVPALLQILSMSWEDGAPAVVRAITNALSFTPFGAATAVGAFGAFDGGGVLAVLAASAVVALATLALLALAWHGAVVRTLHVPPRPRTQLRDRLGWFAMLPGTATGAIGARGLFYWARDRRYLANLAVVPIAGIVPIVPLLIAGVPIEIAALIPMPIMATFLGWIVHNDLAYDSEALWIHVITGARGVADRLGRLVPVTAIALPVLAIAVALTAQLAQAWDHIGVLVAVAACLFLSGLGLSSVASVVAPYAVARPGDSPFRQPQRTGARGVLSPAIVLVGTVGAALPTLILAGRAILGGEPTDGDAIATGIGTGLGVLVVGVAIGAIVFDRRGHRALDLAARA
ncbi:hypothetical protein [Microbacterium sp. gxy059]|uniref:hypothetical protein n=1 Tax=Microbacterium sp. gxy059 TaxID=2957199 RepID=UPI003D983502